MIHNYLGIPHVYGEFDCITLVKLFYEQELSCSFNLPEYPYSKDWMQEFTVNKVDDIALQYGKKFPLTQAKNYDLMVFKSKSGKFATHFAIFLAPNKILHVEDGGTSRIEQLSDYWIEKLYACYRHDKLVR